MTSTTEDYERKLAAIFYANVVSNSRQMGVDQDCPPHFLEAIPQFSCLHGAGRL